MDLKNKLLKCVFLSGIFLSPFVYNPYAVIPFEIPKVWFIRIWIEILVVVGILSFKNEEFIQKRDTYLLCLFVGFVIVAIISSFVGADLNKSWLGNYYRGDGLFTLIHFFALYIFLYFFFQKDWVKDFLRVIAFSGIILSLISVGEWVLINIYGKYGITTWLDDGIGLMFGNPNFLVGYFLICLAPINYFLTTTKIFKTYIIKIATWILIILAIYFTKAWLGFFGLGLFSILNFFLNTKFTQTRPYYFLILFAVAIFLLSLKGNLLNQFGKLTLTDATKVQGQIVAEARQRIYTKAVLAFIKRPVLGYGWANFDYAFKSVDWPIHYEHDVYVDKAHSFVLEIAVTTGLVGVLLYLVIIITSIRNLWNINAEWGRPLVVLFILITLHMQTNIVSVSEELIFWVLIAVSTTLPKGITPLSSA